MSSIATDGASELHIHCFMLDLWWNAGTEEQAFDRDKGERASNGDD